MVLAAVLTFKKAFAHALESVDAIQTLRMIKTRIGFALIDVDHAIFASKSWCAIASEIVDTVVADAAVEARVFSAVVDVGLAIFALESRGTIALVVVNQVHTTAPIETRIFLAFVDVHVAILTLKSGEAIASKVIDQVDATCSVLTGFALFAFIYFGFAELSGETSLAATFHGAYFCLPDPVLSVAVFFAVHANQVFIRRNIVVHACIPIVDVTGGVTVGR